VATVDEKIAARKTVIAGPLKDKLTLATKLVVRAAGARLRSAPLYPPPHCACPPTPRASPHTSPARLPAPHPRPPPISIPQESAGDGYIAGPTLSHGDLNLFSTLSTMVSGWMDGEPCTRGGVGGWDGRGGAKRPGSEQQPRDQARARSAPAAQPGLLGRAARQTHCALPPWRMTPPFTIPGVPKDLLDAYPALKAYRNKIASHPKAGRGGGRLGGEGAGRNGASPHAVPRAAPNHLDAWPGSSLPTTPNPQPQTPTLPPGQGVLRASREPGRRAQGLQARRVRARGARARARPPACPPARGSRAAACCFRGGARAGPARAALQ
jgi:hypothetical protein